MNPNAVRQKRERFYYLLLFNSMKIKKEKIRYFKNTCLSIADEMLEALVWGMAGSDAFYMLDLPNYYSSTLLGTGSSLKSIKIGH